MESSMLADEELTATEALDILHTEASPDVGCRVKGHAPTEMVDEQEQSRDIVSDTDGSPQISTSNLSPPYLSLAPSHPKWWSPLQMCHWH